jgi:hypothetical protein
MLKMKLHSYISSLMVAIIQYLLMFIAEKYIFQHSFRSCIKVKHIEIWNIGAENLD